MDSTQEYNNIVNLSNRAIETVMIAIGLFVVVAMVVAIVIFIISSFKSKKIFDTSLDMMTKKIKEKDEPTQHKCEYCGLIIEPGDNCPHCGAKQHKDS